MFNFVEDDFKLHVGGSVVMVDRAPPTAPGEGEARHHQGGLSAHRQRKPVVVSLAAAGPALGDSGMDVTCSVSTLSRRLSGPDWAPGLVRGRVPTVSGRSF